MKKFEVLEFPIYQDEKKGSLIPFEFTDKIPFEVKRSYIIKDVSNINITRGGHAHLKEKEVFVCLEGKCVIQVDINGEGKKKYYLNSSQKGAFVDTFTWHEFSHFSKDAILLAFSSTEYMPGEENYLEDYSKFCDGFK